MADPLLTFHILRAGRWTMSEPATQPYGAPDPKYSHLASEAQIERAAKHLRDHGFEVVVVADGSAARHEVLTRIPSGSEVYDGTSRTLEETGIAKALAEHPGVVLLKPQLYAMDRKTQATEMRKLSETPAVIVGSVHAVTEDGQVLTGSATGSQLGPYSHGAGRVIWVAGTQKIVPNLEEGLNRIEHYSLPLEDVRAVKAYGMHSSLNRILIFRRENQPGRTTLILVKQNLGF